MNKQLLIQMLELAANNQRSKRITELALQIAVDPELGDTVTVEDISNSIYTVGNIRLLKQCINFRLM
jgi:hypothetical protein